MNNITIGEIVGAIGSITIIIGFVKLIYDFVKKSTLERIDKNENDIKELKSEVEVIKAEVKNSKEERLVLVNGVLACLKGLREQGCDGPVTEGINAIEEYLIKKSHD